MIFFSDGVYFQLHGQLNQIKGIYRKGMGKIFLSPTLPILLYTHNNSISHSNNNFLKITSLQGDYGHTCKTIAKVLHLAILECLKNNILELLLKFFLMSKLFCIEWPLRMGIRLTLSPVPFPTWKGPDAFCRSKRAPYVPSAQTGDPMEAQKSSREAFTGCSLN